MKRRTVLEGVAIGALAVLPRRLSNTDSCTDSTTDDSETDGRIGQARAGWMQCGR